MALVQDAIAFDRMTAKTLLLGTGHDHGTFLWRMTSPKFVLR